MGLAVRAVVLACTAALYAPGPARAASCDQPPRIRFAAGASRGRIEGDLARGEVACWTLGARAGQTLSIVADSPESNAVFQLYPPGWRIEQHQGLYDISGRTLPGAADGQDTRSWSGRLPQTGDTLVVVGMIRGGGHYALQVRIQ
jgi:hypothetical protein